MRGGHFKGRDRPNRQYKRLYTSINRAGVIKAGLARGNNLVLI